MFDHTSRYYKIKDATYITEGGDRVLYKLRRFLPCGEDLPALGQVTVMEGDRPDLVTARTLGDPLQFWRVCDANDAMDPFEMTEQPGRQLKIPDPQV